VERCDGTRGIDPKRACHGINPPSATMSAILIYSFLECEILIQMKPGQLPVHKMLAEEQINAHRGRKVHPVILDSLVNSKNKTNKN
jgi:hypothetical protein